MGRRFDAFRGLLDQPCIIIGKGRRRWKTAAGGGTVPLMTAGANTGLVGSTAKQKAEATNFEAFRLAAPNFAGQTLLSVTWGGDPPDGFA
jgi:hypothetical protein